MCTSKFSANEPGLGYIYQVRMGLLLIIEEENDAAKLFIEKIDDISIETEDGLDVYQTKLHIKSIANLTNSSSDLWKTIRVWSEGIKEGHLNPNTCIFNLITTATASPNSIPFNFKQGIRDIKDIQESLIEVANTSTNETNKASYNSFKSLSDDQQKKLIKNIYVADASIDLNESKNGIKRFLKFSTTPDRVEALYERLEGWFLNEVILQLQYQRSEIYREEVMDKIHDIADSLKSDNLPDDFTVSIATDEDQLSPYRDEMFVKQLAMIEMSSTYINHAISDYHRAFSQKSKWLREGLINATDELNYDAKLIEDWERKHSILEEKEDPELNKREGKHFYVSHYVNNSPSLYIKDRFKEQYMVLGSCQILSDKKKIGWHPEFNTLE